MDVESSSVVEVEIAGDPGCSDRTMAFRIAPSALVSTHRARGRARADRAHFPRFAGDTAHRDVPRVSCPRSGDHPWARSKSASAYNLNNYPEKTRGWGPA